MLLLATTLLAVPAKRGQWKTLTLVDGTQVRAELRGDEFMSYWQAEDGSRYVKAATADCYELADMEALAAQATAARQSITERQAAKQAKKNALNVASTAASSSAEDDSSPATRASLGDESSNYQGTHKGLIILVQFADKEFKAAHTLDLYKQIANAENFSNDMGFVGSVSDYFRDQS